MDRETNKLYVERIMWIPCNREAYRSKYLDSFRACAHVCVSVCRFVHEGVRASYQIQCGSPALNYANALVFSLAIDECLDAQRGEEEEAVEVHRQGGSHPSHF